MMMPLPKMTKAHRMYLYGVLTTGIVGVVVAGMTIVAFLVVSRPTDQSAEAPVHSSWAAPIVPTQAVPITPAAAQPAEVPVIVNGLLESVGENTVVILQADATRVTISVTPTTRLLLLDARAKDPTKSSPLTLSTIPLQQMAHATIQHGTENVATEIVVVKDHD